MQLHTQWRHQWRDSLRTSQWLGLDYPAVEAMLRALRVRRRDQVFANLQAMEFAALPILNGATNG